MTIRSRHRTHRPARSHHTARHFGTDIRDSGDIPSEVDELRAELVELKKAKDIQSEVDELRAELAELKPKQQPKGKFGFFHKQS